jgi:hypothetical protein
VSASRPAEADVVVIGGGLCGSLVALELARAGRHTVVVDAPTSGPEPCLGHVPSGPPVAYVDARRRWGPAGARELWELQQEAHAALRELFREIGEDAGYRSAGDFTLALDRQEGLSLAESEDLLRDDGFAGEFLDGYLLEARFDMRGIAAGYWAEAGAELDLEHLARAAGAAARAAGAVFHELHAFQVRELSKDGVLALTGQGPVRAPVAVLGTAAAATAVVPYFAGRIDVADRRGLRVTGFDASRIPSPARLRALRAGWTVAGGELSLEAVGGDPSDLVAAHLPELPSRAASGAPCRVGLSRDGLPWVGTVPGLPVIAALCGTLDLAYMPLVPRWAVSALLTGRDTTPDRLRAARAAV